ncbi:hypothetical protein [Pseudooctadecabacter sp.]|uniref:hypothetical protein n=1 Tax=Pseudooctadecabacter sp. TaxID=1966338 RepID=UPI0025D8B746|nr:hypothetical protein [Pseudooctadecabacter sp.]
MTLYSPQPRPVVDAPRPVPVAMKFTLRDTTSDLLLREVRLLRDCVASARTRWDFDVEAAVVLPAQMQLLAVFNTGEFGMRQAMALIQTTFRTHLDLPRGLWEGAAHLTRLEWEAMPLRRAFIEAAPVRMGLVQDPGDWPYSSAQRSVPQGRALGVLVA